LAAFNRKTTTTTTTMARRLPKMMQMQTWRAATTEAAAAAAAAPSPEAPHVKVAVIYEFVRDILEKRAPHRAAHLAMLSEARASGLLMQGGAFDPPEAGLIVFNSDDVPAVEAFVKKDPYVANGLVTDYHIRKWNVVV
jgi:uncharacterized protein YciI